MLGWSTAANRTFDAEEEEKPGTRTLDELFTFCICVVGSDLQKMSPTSTLQQIVATFLLAQVQAVGWNLRATLS